MRESARVTSLPVKLAPSHCVAAGLVLAGTDAPAHTLSMLRIGGRSTMPRNDGASEVGGGSVRVTVIWSVHTPPLSLQTLATESLSVRANTRMLGPAGAVGLVDQGAGDGAGVAEADRERTFGGAVRAQPQDLEVAELALDGVGRDELDPRVLAVGVPLDQPLVRLGGDLVAAGDLDRLGDALVGDAVAPVNVRTKTLSGSLSA